MSGQQGTEDAVTTTIRCASAKILTAVDDGASKDKLRNVVLGELNGISRFFIRILRDQAEGYASAREDRPKESG